MTAADGHLRRRATHRRPPRRRAVILVIMIAAMALQSCSSTSPQSAAPTSQTAPTRPTPLNVLQANLCDSGEARCYSGRSVARLGEVIRAESPEIVTLNEICEDDIAAVQQQLDALGTDDVVVSAFAAARDRPTDADYRCRRNGQRFGNGVLARFDGGGPAHTTRSGVYRPQDQNDPEERVWVCLDIPDRFVACSTHLASTVPAVAQAQCKSVMAIAFGAADESERRSTTVIGGDFNLLAGRAPDIGNCLPAGLTRADDTAAQHIVTNADITTSRSIDMQGTTDHPALLAVVTPRRS